MNTIKRFNLVLVILFTAFIFMSSNLFAQQRQEQGPPPIPNETQITKMVDDLSAELSLTATQKTSILTLYTNHFAEVKASMNGKRKSREEMESHRAQFEDKVKSLIDENQKSLFEKFLKSKKESRPNKSRI